MGYAVTPIIHHKKPRWWEKTPIQIVMLLGALSGIVGCLSYITPDQDNPNLSNEEICRLYWHGPSVGGPGHDDCDLSVRDWEDVKKNSGIATYLKTLD